MFYTQFAIRDTKIFWRLLQWWWISLFRQDSVKLEAIGLKTPGRGEAANKFCTELCHLHTRSDWGGGREALEVSAQKVPSLAGAFCRLQAQLQRTVLLQRHENCLTSCQAPSSELVKDEPQKRLKKSSEALLCLKKHLKWKIKGQTPMSLIILIWIDFYWHGEAQQTRTSEPGPRRLAETRPKCRSLLGLEIAWTSPILRRVRITTRTNAAQVTLTLWFPGSAEPPKKYWCTPK